MSRTQTERGVADLRHWKSFKEDIRGDAVVEATILLPIMMMIYLGLILLAMYLPTRALLQRATQYAANAIAIERSDSWLGYNEGEMRYTWARSRDGLENVYAALFHAVTGRSDGEKVRKIVSGVVGREGVMASSEEMGVHCTVVNCVIYKEIQVTATRTFRPPIDLSFVGFPTQIPITVTSTAVVQNGDEFVRNMDIAADVASWAAEKLNLTDLFDKIGTVMTKFNEFLGI